MNVERGYHHGDLRNELVRAALAQLADGGLPAFSVSRVAKRIGVSVAAPYRHFPDRDELLATAATQLTNRLASSCASAAATAGPDPVDQMAATAGAYTGFVIENGAGLELVFASQFAGPRFADLHEQSRGLLDVLLPLAHQASLDPDWNASLGLLQAHLALAHGFAALQILGGFSLIKLTDAQVAGQATTAARALILGARAVGQHE